MATNNDGGFAVTTSHGVGDPYQDPKRPTVHESKGKRQFQTSNPKVGQTADNWGEGNRTFLRLSEKEPYQDPHRREQTQRLQNRAKNRTEFGFKFSSPMKVSSTPGDYSGSFTVNIEHFSEDTYGKRGVRQKITEPTEKKNILTTPMKKGGFGYVGTCLSSGIKAREAGFGNEYEYKGDPYDASKELRKKELAAHKEAIGERKAFRNMQHSVDVFDSAGQFTSASAVYTWDDKCSMKPPPPEESMTPKERVEATADGVLKEGYKAFVPSSYTKTGENSTFERFPQYKHNPYSEKILRRTMMPERHHPVKEVMQSHGLSEALLERKPFRPNSFQKSKLTPGTCLMGINKHNI